MRSRRAVRALAGVALVVVISACGSGDEAGRFDDDVRAVRAAIDAGDRTAIDQALDTLALDALAAEEDGTIDGAELDEVAQLIASVRATAAELVPAEQAEETTTTEPPPTTAPVAVDEADDDDDDDDDDGERGKGKKDKDDD
jgi:hypothetical protein